MDDTEQTSDEYWDKAEEILFDKYWDKAEEILLGKQLGFFFLDGGITLTIFTLVSAEENKDEGYNIFVVEAPMEFYDIEPEYYLLATVKKKDIKMWLKSQGIDEDLLDSE